jgi:hypothetical protein
MSRFIETPWARLDGTYVKWVNQIARTPWLIPEDWIKSADHKIRLSCWIYWKTGMENMLLLSLLNYRSTNGMNILRTYLGRCNNGSAYRACSKLSCGEHRYEKEK